MRPKQRRRHELRFWTRHIKRDREHCRYWIVEVKSPNDICPSYINRRMLISEARDFLDDWRNRHIKVSA